MEGSTVQTEKKARVSSDSFLGFFSNLRNKFTQPEDNGEDEFIRNLRVAQLEWENAELYFQNVTESDLIDYAIYKMEAARTKYIFLLKQARESGIKAENQNKTL